MSTYHDVNVHLDAQVAVPVLQFREHLVHLVLYRCTGTWYLSGTVHTGVHRYTGTRYLVQVPYR